MKVIDLEIGELNGAGYRQMWPGPREALREIIKLEGGIFNPPRTFQEATENKRIHEEICKIKNRWK